MSKDDLNSPSDSSGKNEAIKRVADRAIKSVWNFFVVGFIVAILLSLFNVIADRYDIKKRLEQVPQEVWITATFSTVAGIWKWYTDREQEKIKLAQSKANTTGTIIGEISNQIDSILLQVASLRESIVETRKAMNELEKIERALDQKIDDSNYRILQSKLEILEAIHDKFCFLISQMSHAKGMSEAGDRTHYDRFVNRLSYILEQVGEQLEPYGIKPDLCEETEDEETEEARDTTDTTKT